MTMNERSVATAPADGSKVSSAWERDRKESAQAHRAFLVYLDAGPDRTLQQTAAQVGKSISLMKRWSSRHSWKARAEAHDAAQLEEARQKAQRAHAAALARRTEHAAQLEKIAMAGLRTLLVRDSTTGELRFDSRLKPTDVAALIRAACQLMPTAYAEPASPERADASLSHLSDDELRVLLSLLPKETDKEDSDNE